MAVIGKYFSSTFNVDRAWLIDKGIFDPTLDIDAPLFIDPFLLPFSKHPEFSECGSEKYDEHIGKIYALVREALDGSEKAGRAAVSLFQLGEVKGLQGTCLGYSKRSVRGRGIGKKLATQAFGWAHEVIRLGVKDPEFLSTVPLFEDGIGSDMISDMVANIILKCIIGFNHRCYAAIEEELNVKLYRREFRIGNMDAILPQNPFDNGECAVILLPQDILKFLPLLENPLVLPHYAETNEDVRSRVNAHISEIFQIRYKKDKEAIKRRAMQNADAFQALLDVIKLSERIPYDLRRDPEGLLIWSQIADTTTSLNKLELKDDKRQPEIDRIGSVVVSIVKQFTELVENNRLYQVFYVDQKPRHERFAQLLFLGIAKSYCEANGLDISPESDGGAGPVDFKLSVGTAKVILEIKLSTNPKIVQGYERQIEAYANAEGAAKAHYVVINVGSLGNKWKKLSDLHTRNRGDENGRYIHIVDAIPKMSASKLTRE